MNVKEEANIKFRERLEKFKRDWEPCDKFSLNGVYGLGSNDLPVPKTEDVVLPEIFKKGV